MSGRIKVVAVVGPTASGKTGLAVDLALKYNGEVVSGDSMQIYKKMSVGTAKPTIDEMKSVPHHLIDTVEPSESYSVARYCEDAKNAVDGIVSRGRLPIICGGTGLYIDSFINNIPFAEQDDVHPLREQLQAEYDKDSGEALYEELKSADPQAAEKIHKNNAVKLIRAIEVIRSGSTLSEQIERTRAADSPYDAVYIGLGFADRSILYSRIERRVDEMIQNGLVIEAKSLYETKSELSPTALGAIGYKELFTYFDGKCDFDTAVSEIKKATRRYAKRQLTWFRRNKSINWIEASQPHEKIFEEAQKYMENSGNL